MSNQKTNRSLVGYALARLGTGYVFGTYGQVLTPALLAAKLRQYPSQVRRYESFIRREWLGKPVQDCIGLIKGHLWSDERGRIVYRSNGIPDVSADLMFKMAKEKGPIASLPEIKGLLVWKPGHIGIFVGNGEVIEAHGTVSGVIKTGLIDSVNETKWTHWLKCPFIQYVDVPDEPTGHTYTVQRGDSLWSIAVKLYKNGRRYKEIADLNNIRPPYVIHQKQVLKVPEK